MPCGPANSLWISLGDSGRRVKFAQSIMTSPFVFGIREGKAKELGFIGKEVHVRDILSAIRQKKPSLAMTSASQSNSGASAYIGFLRALLGEPDVITMADLERPGLRDSVRELLAGINRSSGSSGWLETTSELQARNAEMLKQGTLDVARESERGIVEIETLQKVNTHLEGKARRADAETELVKMESELKERLTSIRGGQGS